MYIKSFRSAKKPLLKPYVKTTKQYFPTSNKLDKTEDDK